MPDKLAVIVLTYNSASVIERTVTAAKQVGSTIICVDSGSTDGTAEILRQLGCELHQRPFKHYADQRNWAIHSIGSQYLWQLHLDADEVLDSEACASISAAIESPDPCVGYLLRRRTYFLGRGLRYGGTSSWHLRLFQVGACEDRLYDQHFICDGPTRKLRGWMHDLNVGELTEWTARHNRWSEMEARELLRRDHTSADILKPRIAGDPRQRRRAYKTVYYRSPRFLRAWLYFLFRYVVQLGFLDGRAGFLYAFFQVLWFRMLVDSKLAEFPNAQPRIAGQTTQVGSASR